MSKLTRTLSTLAGLALATVLAAGPAPAADPAAGGGRGHDRIGALLHCLRVIGLSDAQKDSIKAVLEAEKPVVQGLVEQLKTDHDALETAAQANPPKPCDIGTAFLTVKSSREALKAEFEKIRREVGAILTAEQRAKLEGCLAGGPRKSTNAGADDDPDE